MSAPFGRFFTASRNIMYKGYTKNLLISNTLTCGVLLTGGDFIQQRIERHMGHNTSHDVMRSGKIPIFAKKFQLQKCKQTAAI